MILQVCISGRNLSTSIWTLYLHGCSNSHLVLACGSSCISSPNQTFYGTRVQTLGRKTKEEEPRKTGTKKRNSETGTNKEERKKEEPKNEAPKKEEPGGFESWTPSFA